MRFLLLILSSSMLSTGLFSADFGPKKANPTSVRIVPVQPTPEPDNVETTIIFPKEGQVLYGNPVKVQVRLIGFPVGVMSDFDRKNEIFNDSNGQSLLVFVDNHHPIEIYKSFVDSLDNNNIFYKLTLTTRVPFYLKEGMHVIRAFPDRSFGESLKQPGNYAVSTFYIGSRKNNNTIGGKNNASTNNGDIFPVPVIIFMTNPTPIQ